MREKGQDKRRQEKLGKRETDITLDNKQRLRTFTHPFKYKENSHPVNIERETTTKFTF